MLLLLVPPMLWIDDCIAYRIKHPKSSRSIWLERMQVTDIGKAITVVLP